MLVDLFIVSLIGGVVAVDTTAAWQLMICRPIVSGPLVGFFLGDVQSGLHVGALMELLWAGRIPIGASVLPDSNVAAVVAVATAIELQRVLGISYSAISLSILYSVPVAFVGSRLIVWMRKRNAVLVKRALSCAEEGDARNVVIQNWLGIANSFGRGVFYTMAAYFLGMKTLPHAAHLPSLFGRDVFSLSTPIIALGAAVMLTLFGSKKTIPYTVLGLVGGVLLSIL